MAKRATLKLIISLEFAQHARESQQVILQKLSQLGAKMHREVVADAMTELPIEGAGYIVADDGAKEIVLDTIF